MVRQSPMEHAKLFKHSKKKGLDGNMWISQPDINGIFRWKRDNTMKKNHTEKKMPSVKKITSYKKNVTRNKSTSKKKNLTHKKSSKIKPKIFLPTLLTLKIKCLGRETNNDGTYQFSHLNVYSKKLRIKIHSILKQQIEVSEFADSILSKFKILFEGTTALVTFNFFKSASIAQIQIFFTDLVNSLQSGAEDGYLADDEYVDNIEILFDKFELRGDPKLAKNWPRYYFY